MPDLLGPVLIPDPIGIGPFPIRADYGTGMEVPDRVVAHLFDQPGLKTEQRFYLGDGGRRFRVRKQELDCDEYADLKAHWQTAYGIVAEFDYAHPISHTQFLTYRVRYGDPSLSFSHVAGFLTSDPGLTLIEVPQVTPTVNVSKILERFPDAGFSTALLDQRQRVIPLLRIEARGGAAPLYVSDRRLNLANGPDGGTRLHLPRLREWSGISQSVGENSDQAVFTLGNADKVWATYVNAHFDLFRATVDFWLAFEDYPFQGSATLLKLWKGYIEAQRFLEDGSFEIACADGVYELNLAYPTRQVLRTCWKQFKDGVWCPYVGPETVCPKSWNDCVERGMNLYFGGVNAPAQTIRVKDNSTGTWGFGRSRLTSVTVKADTVYQRVLQEVYTDTIRPPGPGGETVSGPSLPVVCDVAGGRDEDTFYAAIGIVGEGPIKAYDGDLAKHQLDGQIPHDPEKGGGWRPVQGFDPALANDFFGISQAPWDQIPPGSTYAAGTAFAEIRRTDPKGLQLSKATERSMTVAVSEGIGGWTWTAPGSRVWTWPLTNPVWIAVNVYLKALGLKADPNHPQIITAAMQEAYFDVAEAVYWAGHCDTDVDKIIGAGKERQFPFRGILREQKPLRDWLQEILNTCLGYYTFVAGKLRIGIRMHSGASSAFTMANILHRSLQAEPVLGSFNYLTGEFGDEEFDWQLNRVVIYDIDNARFFGRDSSPRFTQSQMSLVGVSNKSQAARIVTTRLREELGGITREEQRQARNISLRTTVLALGIYPGQICSVDHPDLPGGRAEFRVMRWRLNPDWTIDISGSSTCDSMYNLVIGPKPADVPADPVPPERFPSARGLAWLPNEIGPFTGDPVYGPDERTFALWQYYPIEAEGTYSPTIVVRGEMLINQFLEGDPSAIRRVRYETTGGFLKGAQTYYIQVAQRDASVSGQFLAPSNVAAVWIPAGTNTNRILIERIQAGEAMPGYGLWAGLDMRTLSQITDAPSTPLPASLTITGPLARHAMRGAPNAGGRRVRIKCKEVEHSGVAGIQVQAVTAPRFIQSNELIGSDTDQLWVGQILSVLADAYSPVDEVSGTVPLWNFTIVGFNKTTGTLEVSPDCVRASADDSVQAGDVMIIRSRASGATANTITNTLWDNSVGEAQWGASNGLIPDYEIGLLIRIIAGAGRGQVREIVSNTNLTHTVHPPWRIVPDTTSIYIVEYPDWIHEAETSTLEVKAEDQRLEIGVRVDNLAGNVVLVGGFLVDDLELETMEEVACYREIFVFGQPYDVRRVQQQGTATETLITDQTMRVNTSAGDVTIELTEAGPYFGRAMLVVNDGVGAGAGRVIIKPKATAGDQFQTGEAEIILENPGDWAELVAGGDPVEVAAFERRPASIFNRFGRRTAHPSFSRRRRGRKGDA